MHGLIALFKLSIQLKQFSFGTCTFISFFCTVNYECGYQTLFCVLIFCRLKMQCHLGDLSFNPVSRKVDISRNGKNVFTARLATSLDGFQQVSDPVQLSLKESYHEGFLFEWPGLTKLDIRIKSISPKVQCYQIEWMPQSWDFVPVDVVELSDAHWFGGAEMYDQKWPSDKQTIRMHNFLASVSKHKAFAPERKIMFYPASEINSQICPLLPTLKKWLSQNI